MRAVLQEKESACGIQCEVCNVVDVGGLCCAISDAWQATPDDFNDGFGDFAPLENVRIESCNIGVSLFGKDDASGAFEPVFAFSCDVGDGHGACDGADTRRGGAGPPTVDESFVNLAIAIIVQTVAHFGSLFDDAFAWGPASVGIAVLCSLLAGSFAGYDLCCGARLFVARCAFFWGVGRGFGPWLGCGFGCGFGFGFGGRGFGECRIWWCGFGFWLGCVGGLWFVGEGGAFVCGADGEGTRLDALDGDVVFAFLGGQRPGDKRPLEPAFVWIGL